MIPEVLHVKTQDILGLMRVTNLENPEQYSSWRIRKELPKKCPRWRNVETWIFKQVDDNKGEHVHGGAQQQEDHSHGR